MALPPPPPPAAADSGPSAAMTCYRHPDREVGRRCTRCGKPACTDCLVQAPVGSHCLECAKAARPDLRTKARFWHAGQPALVSVILIALNLAVFAYTIVRAPEALSGRITQVHVDLGLARVFVEQGEWYRLITAGFLHFGFIHIGFNMYLLYLLGQMLEPSLGRVRFLLVYVAGLLGGSAGSLLLDGGNSIAGGASGAVFGLMGLAFVGAYLHGANPMSSSIGTLFVMNLFITFVIPNISIGGHLGGAVAGALCALVVMAPRHRGYPVWATYAAPAAISALSVVIAVVTIA